LLAFQVKSSQVKSSQVKLRLRKLPHSVTGTAVWGEGRERCV
jgi:hypothetical protein